MRIEPNPDGVEIEIEPELVDFLIRFPDMLDGLGPDDPASRRLNVPVYLDDPEANAEWWGFMGSELAESRRADRSAFREVLAAAKTGTVMSRAEAWAMIRVVNEARLGHAARVGVEVESDYQTLEPHDLHLLEALAQLQMAIIWALEQ